MARTCGIRLGLRRYEIVVLDGTPKKHKIFAFKAGEFTAPEEGGAPDRVAVLEEALNELGVSKDSIGLVVDSSKAAYRMVTLPFSDASKIDQVIKFEVESELPHWSIDDVIVDYQVIASTEVSSVALVSALPKEYLRESLEVLERAGYEAIEAELDTTAMVNAATHAGLCGLDDAQVLLHVAEYATAVVVMDAGKVRSMRVIHIGALSHEAEDVPGDAEGEEAENKPTGPKLTIEQETQRLRRELGRSLGSARTVNEISAIYMCGIELPGFVGTEVFGIPTYVLDCFEGEDGRPADGFGPLVVPYGAALRELGGGELSPRLRREELKYAGTWERLEFPLAVASLMLATFLAGLFILQNEEAAILNAGAGTWVLTSNNLMVGDPRAGKPGTLSPVPEDIEELVKDLKDGEEGQLGPDEEDPTEDYLQAAKDIDAALRREVAKLKRELGEDIAIEQPQSALVGAFLVLDILAENEQAWHPSIRSIDATTQAAKSGNPEHVKINLGLVFIADNTTQATQHYEAFRDQVEQQDWFMALPLATTKTLENSKGIFVDNLNVSVNVQAYYDQMQSNARGPIQ